MRGSTWGLGSSAGPLRAALSPAGRGTWGPEHHANVESRLGRTAQWAILCEDLPEDSNRVDLDPDTVDSDGLPGVRVQYRFSENSRRMIDVHGGAGGGVAAGGRGRIHRVDDRHPQRPSHGHGTDGRRPADAPSSTPTG